MDFHRDNARRYLLSLQSGQKPDIRPDFGPFWEPLIRKAEEQFDKCKPALRAKQMPKRLATLANLSQFQPLRLLELLSEAPPAKPEQGAGMPALPAEAHRPTGLLPQVSPWLTEYIAYSKKLSPEGFKDFHLGCGLWILSTVAARRIQVPLNDPVMTPLSLVMCARTTLFAKTTTARAAKKVLKEAGLDSRLGDDETTPQRLLYDMAGHVPPNYADMDDLARDEARAKLAMSGQIGWYYDEFGQLVDALKRQGPMAEFAGLLRKLDNCEEQYRYSTKSGGQDKINNPYVALLASTTPADLAAHASKNNRMWNDGFWARMLFMCPEPNSFLKYTMKKGVIRPPAQITEKLKRWHQQLGIPSCSITEKLDKKGEGTGHFSAECDPLPMADIEMEDGIEEAFACYREALRDLVASNSIQDLDGSYGRLPTLALRIAALIASLENDNFLTLDIWSAAQEIAEMFRENLHRLYHQISNPVDENATEDILIAFLKSKQSEGGVTVRQIVQFGPPELRKVKTEGIRVMLLNLERSGIVTITRTGKKECYTLTQDSDQQKDAS